MYNILKKSLLLFVVTLLALPSFCQNKYTDEAISHNQRAGQFYFAQVPAKANTQSRPSNSALSQDPSSAQSNPTTYSINAGSNMAITKVIIGKNDTALHRNQWVQITGLITNVKNTGTIKIVITSEEGVSIKSDTISHLVDKSDVRSGERVIATSFKLLENKTESNKIKLTLTAFGDIDTRIVTTFINYSNTDFTEYPTSISHAGLQGTWISSYKLNGKSRFWVFNKDNTFDYFTNNGYVDIVQKGTWSIENKFGKDDSANFEDINPIGYVQRNDYLFESKKYSASMFKRPSENCIWLRSSMFLKIAPILNDDLPVVKKLNSYLIGKWVNSDQTYGIEYKANHTLVQWNNYNKTGTGSWYWELEVDKATKKLLCYLILINDNVRGVEKKQIDLTRLSKEVFYEKQSSQTHVFKESDEFFPRFRRDDIKIPIENVNMSLDEILGYAILGTAIKSASSSNGLFSPNTGKPSGSGREIIDFDSNGIPIYQGQTREGGYDQMGKKRN